MTKVQRTKGARNGRKPASRHRADETQGPTGAPFAFDIDKMIQDRTDYLAGCLRQLRHHADEV